MPWKLDCTLLTARAEVSGSPERQASRNRLQSDVEERTAGYERRQVAPKEAHKRKRCVGRGLPRG